MFPGRRAAVDTLELKSCRFACGTASGRAEVHPGGHCPCSPSQGRGSAGTSWGSGLLSRWPPAAGQLRIKHCQPWYPMLLRWPPPQLTASCLMFPVLFPLFPLRVQGVGTHVPNCFSSRVPGAKGGLKALLGGFEPQLLSEALVTPGRSCTRSLPQFPPLPSRNEG